MGSGRDHGDVRVPGARMPPVPLERPPTQPNRLLFSCPLLFKVSIQQPMAVADLRAVPANLFHRSPSNAD
jgi:hypothetical protein